MTKALDVARYLLRIAAPTEDEDSDYLTHLRLQKLLYYAQAWHLAAYDKPLFAGTIEAWRNGPVVRELYPSFSQYKSNVIPPSEGDDAPELSERDKFFIRTVWGEYKNYSASALRDMTHSEKTWQQAFSASKSSGTDVEITHDAMRDFFSPRLKKKLQRSDSRVNLTLWDAAEDAIRENRVRTVQELRRELQDRSTGTDPG